MTAKGKGMRVVMLTVSVEWQLSCLTDYTGCVFVGVRVELQQKLEKSDLLA